MIRYIILTEINDLKDFMAMASKSEYDIGVHTGKNQIVDAKSILGLISIDYSKPLIVVTEDEKFLKKLDRWAIESDKLIM